MRYAMLTTIGIGLGALAAAPGALADAPAADQPSLNEPAPTPGWAIGGPSDAAKMMPPTRHHAGKRQAAESHRAVRQSGNPFADAARGVVGGVANLGSVAAYPVYCFPNYGSCRVRTPYQP